MARSKAARWFTPPVAGSQRFTHCSLRGPARPEHAELIQRVLAMPSKRHHTTIVRPRGRTRVAGRRSWRGLSCGSARGSSATDRAASAACRQAHGHGLRLE